MENMTRRDFGKLAGMTGLGLAVGSAATLTGCNWVQDVENWTATAEESVASIESILTANGQTIPAAPLAVVNAALAAVHEAAAAYLATSPAPVGALQKVEAALSACSEAIGAFLTALGLPGGGLLTLVTELGEFLLSTIAGFVNEATAASGTQVAATSFRVAGNVYSVTPTVRSKRAYKKGWNQLLRKASGVNVPKGAELHVSFFEHF